jgi:hypothetical protein
MGVLYTIGRHLPVDLHSRLRAPGVGLKLSLTLNVLIAQSYRLAEATGGTAPHSLIRT